MIQGAENKPVQYKAYAFQTIQLFKEKKKDKGLDYFE